MRIVDANVLLHAVNGASRDHERSRTWLDEALNGREVVGLPWVVLLAFLRLSTRRGVFPRPLDVAAATGVVRGWLDQPSCTVPEPTARHAVVLSGLLEEAGTAGNLVTDAHLAALAVEHRATVVTYDRDFGRFAGVRSQQPG